MDVIKPFICQTKIACCDIASYDIKNVINNNNTLYLIIINNLAIYSYSHLLSTITTMEIIDSKTYKPRIVPGMNEILMIAEYH